MAGSNDWYSSTAGSAPNTGGLTRQSALENLTGRTDAARGGAWIPGRSMLTPEQLAEHAFADSANARLMEDRARRLARKGDRRALKRTAKLDSLQDSYNAAFGELQRESQDAYREFINRGRGYAQQGDEWLSQGMDEYQAILAGERPSMAELSVKDAANRTGQLATAVASGARGNPILALRQAQATIAQGGQDAALKAGMIRLQEQEAARAALMGTGLARSGQGNQLQAEAQGELAQNLEDERNAVAEQFNTDRARADQRRQQNLSAVTSTIGAAAGSTGQALSGGMSGKGSDVRMKKNITGPAKTELEAIGRSLQPGMLADKVANSRRK